MIIEHSPTDPSRVKAVIVEMRYERCTESEAELYVADEGECWPARRVTGSIRVVAWDVEPEA